MDIGQARNDLEALMTDTVRVSRTAGQPELDPVTGEPGETPTSVVYEGPGAVLSSHGQLVVAHILGFDWLSEGAAWYRLVTPVGAPVAMPGDLVEVIEAISPDGAEGRTGRVWLAEDATEASTVEICRTTRLTERILHAPSAI
ncbi:DUF6093 family protein [Streptomyces kebangsaanensis]|uniref:DUF6093 family protein n=1 Tax=Streptomyces kebangsaanensis TaxID=864058 RepID=UPI00093B1574|nr:DUF6093 family protein [Streptomyces kebangsaanensis]